MITASRYIERYQWSVTVAAGVKKSDMKAVTRMLMQIGCGDDAIHEACLHFDGGKDKGLTYTNVRDRVSLVLIGESSSDGEFVNTSAHELLHVVAHICGAWGTDMDSESPCYLMGELSQWLYESVEKC